MDELMIHIYKVKAQWITQIFKQKNELGITNEKLASLSGVDLETIEEIENDEIIASFDQILRIAFSFGMKARLEST